MVLTPSAGRRLALALFLALMLVGCRTASDTQAVTALVVKLMAILAPGDSAPRTEDLSSIFIDLDVSATSSMTEGLAPLSGDVSYTVQEVRFPPFGGASVSVALASSDGATSTLELRARKVRGEWKLDPAFHLKRTLGEVKAPGS